MGLQNSVPCWVVGRMTDKLPFAREAVRLGDLISKAKIERCGERSLPVLSMTMHDGITRQSDRFKKVVASRNTSSYKVVQPGQLVVGFPIDEGVIYVQDFDEPGIMSPAYNVWNIDSAKVLPGYLNAALHSPQSMRYYRAKLRGTTARRRTITDANLLALRIPLPDINEQHQIVESLNSIQNDIGSCDSQLDIISSLIKSRFVEMFGNICEGMSCFDVTPINDLCTRIVGGGTPSMKHPEYYEDGTIPWLKSGDVKARVVGSGVLNITEAGLANSSARMVPEGSIIVVTRSGILKHSLPVAKAACPIAINQDLKALIPGDRILPDYLQWSLIVASPLLLSKVRATTADNIETSFLKSFKVPVPPVSLQREFVAFVAQVDKLRFEQLLALKKRGSQYLIAP